MLSLLNGLRFIDSFFPSGGYAYSSGLEAAVQCGRVQNSGELSRYVEDMLRGGMGRCEEVAVGLAEGAVESNVLETLSTVDEELDAMKLSSVARLATRQMGLKII